jgi:hypothetical protein
MPSATLEFPSFKASFVAESIGSGRFLSTKAALAINGAFSLPEKISSFSEIPR